jgi:hypothetical protein
MYDVSGVTEPSPLFDMSDVRWHGLLPTPHSILHVWEFIERCKCRDAAAKVRIAA